MSGKRALVVDDSKSARTFLSKVLEDHELQVDTAESAEQAIDYLAHNRPDVIFMDHLMPGMDGFQAVQAIKNNPRTATIPILMYTSQEGELYLGQARALGAIGVLPKQVAPADVGKVLQQLHLAGEDASASAATPGPLYIDIPPAALDGEQVLQLQRFIEQSLESHRERVLQDLRPLLAPARRGWLGALAAFGLIAALLFALLYVQQRAQVRTLQARLAQAEASVAPGPAAASSPVAVASSPSDAVAAADLRVVHVPFGQIPLDGERTEQLREVISTLAAEGFKGTVELARYAGRFCLSGDEGGGYALAPAALPYVQCDLMADAGDAELGAGPVESLAFANLLSELRKAHGAIRIEVVEGADPTLSRAYPEVGGTPPRVPTAGEWNEAALANNRIEIRWRGNP